MKGGGIIGILGGTLGTALLAKGMKSGGSALLGSLLQTAVGASGGKGSGRGSGGGGKSGGMAESLLDAAVSGLSSGKGGKGAGKGSGRGGAGKGRGKGGKAQEEAPLSELLEKTMDAFQSRGGKPQGRAIDVPSEQTTLLEASADVEVRPVEQSGDERREQAVLRLNEATVSALPGRVRLRHDAFKEPAVQALRSALLEAGMDEAAFNAKTGSVLLTYDSSKLDAVAFLEAVLPLGEFLLDWQG